MTLFETVHNLLPTFTIITMPKNWILITSSVLVLPFNLFIFSIASANFRAGSVFLLGCILYWLYISLIILLLHKEDSPSLMKMVSPNAESRYAVILKAAVFLPAIGAFFVVFLPNIESVNLKTGLIILGISIVNGTIEEVYWRGLYIKIFKENRYLILIVSPLLFTLMHGSFLAIKGVTYHGGISALVGGALFMGFLWSYVSLKLNSIRYCIAAHILVNILAFTGLFVENNFKFF